MQNQQLQYSDKDIARIVAARRARRQQRQYTTPWGKQAQGHGDYEHIGVLGEVAFAERFGMPVDERDLTNGDGGIDFTTIIGKVDVKTARARDAMLKVKVRAHYNADFFFLATYDRKHDRAHLVGYVTREELLRWPTEGENGHANYVVPQEYLRPVADFTTALNTARASWLDKVAA